MPALTRMEAHSQIKDDGAGRRPQVYGQPTVSNPQTRPLSPPIDPQLEFNSHLQSPSTASSQASHLGGPATSNLDLQVQQQAGPTSAHPGNAPPNSSQSPYMNAPYLDSASANGSYAYPPTTNGSGPAPSQIYSQRPLPTFSPVDSPENHAQLGNDSAEMPPAGPSTPSQQWQQQHSHHHYISPSTSATFPGQAQDRYVCQVCNKAFSRPSSLRIHSHSHTGEKPFQCPHKGCGKAFSVRSNMKRHERGCHGTGGESPSSNH